MKEVPAAWKLSKIKDGAMTSVVCFGKENTETKSKTAKIVLGLRPGEDGLLVCLQFLG